MHRGRQWLLTLKAILCYSYPAYLLLSQFMESDEIHRVTPIAYAIEGRLSGTEHIGVPSQINPFATAARESASHQQTEML